MTTPVSVLIAAKVAEDAVTTQYTSTNVWTLVDKFTATCFAATTETISVAVISSTAPAWDNANIIVRDRALRQNETYTFPEIVGASLNPGDFIATQASDPNAINIRASGRILT